MFSTTSTSTSKIIHGSRRKWSRLCAAGLSICVAAGLALTAPAAGQQTASEDGGRRAPDTYVAQWDEVGSTAFSAAGLSPAEGHVIFAYAAIAVYDSVMAVDPRYEPFAVRARAPKGTSAEAAVAAAAHRIYSHYLPDQAATILDPAYQASLATIPDGIPKTEGMALGERVAAALIALRQDDGFRVPVTYTPPDPPIPGVWIPTAPTPPGGTYSGRMRPFALNSTDQFRPNGPPDLGSRRWARDYNEVKRVGSIDSKTRTAEQTLVARFWAEAPVQQAHGGLRLFLSEHGLDIVQAARFMAMVSVTFADALNACFEAKYHYVFWRPITAIRAGDTDGNDATVGDPAWTPLLPVTPNHPEYPSAHSCITPAGGVAMSRFLGTRHIDFTLPSLTGLGDRHYATPAALTREVTNARIWGGIHFRTAVKDGVKISLKTVRAVLADNFKRQ